MLRLLMIAITTAVSVFCLLTMHVAAAPASGNGPTQIERLARG